MNDVVPHQDIEDIEETTLEEQSTSGELQVVEEAQPPANSLLQVIERAATDPRVDIDKMERLLSMQERVFDRDAQMEFNAAMAAAQGEMKPVVRNMRNDQTRSSYADLEAIDKTITPISTKHGFAMSFGTADCPVTDHYRITCELTHVAGWSKNYHADVPIDLTGMRGQQNKTRTHAFGSTMSYGRRYLKLLIFDIATEDDDAQGSKWMQTEQEYVSRMARAQQEAGGTDGEGFGKTDVDAEIEEAVVEEVDQSEPEEAMEAPEIAQEAETAPEEERPTEDATGDPERADANRMEYQIKSVHSGLYQLKTKRAIDNFYRTNYKEKVDALPTDQRVVIEKIYDAHVDRVSGNITPEAAADVVKEAIAKVKGEDDGDG